MPKDRIELIARGLLVVADHLLLCRSLGQGHLFLPGGHVDFDEPAAAALVRELHEEAGLRVTAGPLLATCESAFTQSSKHGPRRHHELNLVFQLALPGRKRAVPPRVASKEDHIEFLWAPLADCVAPDRSPRRAHPRLKILPPGLVELALQNQRPAWRSIWNPK